MDKALQQGKVGGFGILALLSKDIMQCLGMLALQNRQLYCWHCKLGLSVV